MNITSSRFAMKLEQEKLRNLLTDTILLLCNNGLKYKQELKVEGLIGITVDCEEVFLVNLNESRKGKDSAVGGLVHSTTSFHERDEHLSSDSESSPCTKRRRRKRKSTPSHLSLKDLEEVEAVEAEASTSTALNNAFFPLLKIKKEKEDNEFSRFHNREESSTAAAISVLSDNQSIEENPTQGKNTDLSCMMAGAESLTPLSASNHGGWMDSDVPGRLQLFPDWSPQSLQALSVAQQMRMPSEFTTDLTHCTPRRPRNGLKPFACPLGFCSKSFYYKHHLKRHIRLKHKEYIQVVPPVVMSDPVRSGSMQDFGHIDLTTAAFSLMGQFQGHRKPPDGRRDRGQNDTLDDAQDDAQDDDNDAQDDDHDAQDDEDLSDE